MVVTHGKKGSKMPYGAEIGGKHTGWEDKLVTMVPTASGLQVSLAAFSPGNNQRSGDPRSFKVRGLVTDIQTFY